MLFVLYTTLNISATDNFADETQKDFESVIQVIGMQNSPVIVHRPLLLDGTGDNVLEHFGAPTLTGAGWTVRLRFEQESGRPHTISTLIDDLHGIVLNCGVINMKHNINMEIKQEL